MINKIVNYSIKRLEYFIKEDEKLYGEYLTIKKLSSEILKWTPPLDETVSGIPPYYTDHGIEHCVRILNILDRLTEKIKLRNSEIFPLLCAVWFHDIGMFVGKQQGDSYETIRDLHHIRSVEYVKNETTAKRLPLSQWHLLNVLDICRAHRNCVIFDAHPKIPKERPSEDGSEPIRVQLLCCLLRIADACDIHNSRAPEAIFDIHKKFINDISQDHWKKHFRTGQVIFNWHKSSAEITFNFSSDESEKLKQQILAQHLQDELLAELKSVENIFEEYSIDLYYSSIKDYSSGKLIDLSHLVDKNTLGWTLTPFSKEATTQDLDVLMLQPLLSTQEVTKCYVAIPTLKSIVKEIEKQKLNQSYLFCSHPRTGKTSFLAYLSSRAATKGRKVFWFTKQSKLPTSREFIRTLSRMVEEEEKPILVFDNIHTDAKIITLISDLKTEMSSTTFWCASRISEFVNLREHWKLTGDDFIEKEFPGYLDQDSAMLFIARYSELIDEESKKVILSQDNITPYYLISVYNHLKDNTESEVKLEPYQVVQQVPVDVEDDNRKTFGDLNEIERLALKIICYLDVTPYSLLNDLLLRVDSKKGQKVIDTLLLRRIAFSSKTTLYVPIKIEIHTIDVFDSFKEFISAQMFDMDRISVLPLLLLEEARGKNADPPLALLALMTLFEKLNVKRKESMKIIVTEQIDNPKVQWIAGYLSDQDFSYLDLADYAYKNSNSISKHILNNFGHAFSLNENHKQAVAFLKKAIELGDDDAQSFHQLAHSYQEIGNIEDSINYMKKAAAKDTTYYHCLGLVYNEAGMDDEAYNAYQLSIKNDPNDAKTWNNLGVLEYKLGENEKAKDYFLKALEIDPKFIWSLRGMVDITRLSGQFTDAIDYCFRIMSITSKDDVTYDKLAEICLDITDHKLAMKSLKNAIKLAPEQAGLYYSMGYIYGTQSKSESAINYYSKAIERNPKFVEAYVNRGAVYYNYKSDFKSALADFKKAVSIQALHALAHSCLGNAYLKLDLPEKAIIEYEKALSLDTGEHIKAHKDAKSRLHTIKFNEIQEMIKNGNSINMEDLVDFEALEINKIAYKMIMSETKYDSSKVIKIGIQRDPSYSYLYATKGLLHFLNGDVSEGNTQYLKAVSMSPDDLDLKKKYHYEYGKALRFQGKFDEALTELNNCLSINSDYVLKEDIQSEITKVNLKDCN